MTTSTLTRFYQDVDGVLNAEMPLGWGKTAEGVAAIDDSSRFRIRWAPALVDAINALDVEYVWATTWVSAAQTSIAPLLGITQPSRVLEPVDGEVSFPSISWKLESLLIDQEESPSRFVWLDDEIDFYEQDVALSLGGYAPLLNSRLGITPAIMENIQKYIDGANPLDLLSPVR